MAVHRLLRKFERRNRGRILAGIVENLIAAVQTRHTSKRRGCVSDNENHFQDSFYIIFMGDVSYTVNCQPAVR